MAFYRHRRVIGAASEIKNRKNVHVFLSDHLLHSSSLVDSIHFLQLDSRWRAHEKQSKRRRPISWGIKLKILCVHLQFCRLLLTSNISSSKKRCTKLLLTLVIFILLLLLGFNTIACQVWFNFSCFSFVFSRRQRYFPFSSFFWF